MGLGLDPCSRRDPCLALVTAAEMHKGPPVTPLRAVYLSVPASVSQLRVSVPALLPGESHHENSMRIFDSIGRGFDLLHIAVLVQ